MSSSLEYGNKKSPHNEKMKIDLRGLKSSYSLGKAKASMYLLKLSEKYKFPVIIFRLYLAYGPEQDFNRIIPITIKKFLNNQNFKLTHCNQVRDFIFIKDLINLLMKAIYVKKNKNIVYNVGSGRPVKLRKIIEFIHKKIKKGKPLFGQIPLRKDESYKIYPNISSSKKTFSWTPLISLSEGLNKTIKFYEFNRKKYSC